jgi:hypothetical protein
MLVPLETLVGWPVAPDPPLTHVLGLLVGLPLLAALIITLLGKASSLAKAGRGGSSTRTGTASSAAGATDPVWLGNAPESKELTEGASTQTETGGASARW